MKYIPNLLTAMRVLCTVFLLFVAPFSIYFFVLYMLGGLTDILDGFLARKLEVSS